MPAVPAAQMHPASALHMFPLAFYEPAPASAGEAPRRHLQLQRGQLLHQVRRDHGHLPRRGRVSLAANLGPF